MPTEISLDLTAMDMETSAERREHAGFKASDFRLHGGPDLAETHWLLRHPYGREVLVTKLREVRPDVKVRRYQTAPEHEQFLDAMIDYMDMRDWPEPRTIGERVRAALLLVRYGFCMGGGYRLPHWKMMYAKRAP